MPGIVEARCGMIAHTSVTNTAVSMVWATSATLEVENDSATTIRSRYAKPAAAVLETEPFPGYFGFPREQAQPVIMGGFSMDPAEPMVWNLASAPEEGCCDLIPGIQADILSLQEAVENLMDPDISYLADPGNFVPAFVNNL